MRKGFTLLEVVISLTILGVGIAGLLSLFSGSLRLAGGARDTSTASVYAAQRLEEALLAPDPVPGEEHGPFGEKYRWVARTTPLSPDGEIGKYRAVRIEVIVSWDDALGERSVNMAATRWQKERAEAGDAGG